MVHAHTMPKALVFDFDGVISLSEGPRFVFLQQALADHGVILPDIGATKLTGRTTSDFLKDLELIGLTEEIKEQVRERYKKEFKANITSHAKPNLPVVRFIKNYEGDLPMAIATGSHSESVQKVIKLFGISNKFQTIVGNEHVENNKPHPEAYLTAAERLNVDPTEILVIEDSPAGLQSAKAAGAKAYIVLNGSNQKAHFEENAPHGFVETEMDLHDLVRT